MMSDINIPHAKGDGSIVTNEPMFIGDGNIYVIGVRGPGINTREIRLTQTFLDRILLLENRTFALEERLRKVHFWVTAAYIGYAAAALQATAHVFGWW
jgi:hypothetical protein